MDRFDELADASFDELCVIKKSMIEAMGYAHQMGVDLEIKGDYDNMDLLTGISACCLKVLGSIKNAEEIARLEKYEPVRVNMLEYLDELSTACYARLKRFRINMSFECDENIFVNVDVDRLTACLMNLIINSVQNNDANESCGEIKIRVAKLTDSASVTVSDDGYGMDSGRLNEFLSSENYKGGLAVVRKFCEKAGTQIITEADVDAGVMVSFRLPLADENSLSLRQGRPIVQTGPYSTVNVLLTKIDGAIIYP